MRFIFPVYLVVIIVCFIQDSKIAIVLVITEANYLVLGPFHYLMRVHLLLLYICDIKFYGRSYFLCSGILRKEVIPTTKCFAAN